MAFVHAAAVGPTSAIAVEDLQLNPLIPSVGKGFRLSNQGIENCLVAIENYDQAAAKNQALGSKPTWKAVRGKINLMYSPPLMDKKIIFRCR